MPTSGNYIARITGSPIVPRTLTAAVRGPRELAVDSIALGGQFDLEFYRQLVRDAYDNAGVRRPLYRLARVPSIYCEPSIRAAARSATQSIPSSIALTQSIVDWSGGTFSRPIVERGTDSRESVSGWQTVKWDSDPNGQHCGMADIAGEGGVITFWPRTPGCRCAGQPSIAPPVVRHEVGHMMGFFHSSNQSDLMYPFAVDCRHEITARERHHAAIAYQRPIGNVDQDTDPSSVVNLAPLRAIPGAGREWSGSGGWRNVPISGDDRRMDRPPNAAMSEGTLVDGRRLELPTSALRTRRSPN